MHYTHTLTPLAQPPPLLADYPEFVEPLPCEARFLAPPLVHDAAGRLTVRAWRYTYNARGIVETENRLDGRATAIVMVHPWSIDDAYGLTTPEPAGCAFFCTVEKNRMAHRHMRDVVTPFLNRLRAHVALVGYSLPGVEDPIRKRLYASLQTPPEALDPIEGERRLASVLRAHAYRGAPLIADLTLDDTAPVRSYFEQVQSTDAGERYNGKGYWDLPMPLAKDIAHARTDLVFYDGEGYAKIRDAFRRRGIRHVLILGYCTDMCVVSTTCGYQNFSRDFNVFLVGDATLATYPGSQTPRFATQVALANAALTQLVTQASWIQTL